MKSSAKITVTFLAAAALGTLAIATGCTVTSGTVDDTDGGTQPSGDSGTGTDTGTGSNADTGTVAPTCNSGADPNTVFLSKECQACLDTNCCSELTACYAIAPDEANGKLGCNDYDKCNTDCIDKNGDQACYDACDATAQTGVKEAYDGIVTCGETKCATPCGGGGDPDAGADGG